MDEEIWKDVPGFGGIYQVSNAGRVRSRFGPGRILKQSNNTCGYPKVRLLEKTFPVHRLVASAFVPNPQNKPEIDHINTIRTDNRAENLRWVTHKENTNNQISVAHYRKMNNIYAVNERKRKPVVQTLNGKIVAEYESMREAERRTGVLHGSILKAIKGKFSHAGGFGWRFK